MWFWIIGGLLVLLLGLPVAVLFAMSVKINRAGDSGSID
jgi:hypothetical protein